MHYLANPARFLRIARALTPWFLWSGIALILVGCYSGLFITPPDYLQGESVRILYIHVPAAWLGMGGWTGIGIASLCYVVWRHPLAAVAARAIAVPGAMFTAICLATGSIWGRPTWGTWWEWDGRMTSMLLMFFIYLGYIAYAQSVKNQSSGDRSLAVLGIIGVVNLPIIHGSVIWWKSLHQAPSFSSRGSAISSELVWPLGLTLIGFSLLFGAIILMRMRTILAEVKAEARARRLAEI
ncbi:MAG: heme ABC transporter permease CcmC [Sphingorhabdus sp.]